MLKNGNHADFTPIMRNFARSKQKVQIVNR